MALNSNALVTLDEAKTYLSIPLADSTFDARVEQLINAASQMIEDHCDRVFEFKSYTIQRDGRRADRIVLPEYPVFDVQNLWDDAAWDFTAPSVIPPTDYIIEEESTIVLRAGRKFSRGNGNVKVQFRAGYKLPGQPTGPNLPGSVQLACLMIIMWLDSLRQDRRFGVASKGKQGESISFNDSEIPLPAQKLLADFVRFEIPLLDALTGNA